MKFLKSRIESVEQNHFIIVIRSFHKPNGSILSSYSSKSIQPPIITITWVNYRLYLLLLRWHWHSPYCTFLVAITPFVTIKRGSAGFVLHFALSMAGHEVQVTSIILHTIRTLCSDSVAFNLGQTYVFFVTYKCGVPFFLCFKRLEKRQNWISYVHFHTRILEWCGHARSSFSHPFYLFGWFMRQTWMGNIQFAYTPFIFSFVNTSGPNPNRFYLLSIEKTSLILSKQKKNVFYSILILFVQYNFLERFYEIILFFISKAIAITKRENPGTIY